MQKQLCGMAYGCALILASALVCLLAGDATALFFTIPCGVLIMWKPEVIAMERRIEVADYEIRCVRGHYEIYLEGEFLCSGDTQNECLEALDDLPFDLPAA